MNSASSIHAIILTFNEERHLARCIESINQHCNTITVVDSGSTDATLSIARHYGCKVINNKWVNHSSQINFGINCVADRGGWLFRIDADEVLDRDSGEKLSEVVDGIDGSIDGILVQRRIHFLNQRISYGSIEPSWQLRLWRNGRGRCESRWMDEHIQVIGEVRESRVIISDINLNSLTWWIDKHNGYASREAIDILITRYNLKSNGSHDNPTGPTGPQAKRKRYLKEKLYARLPAATRALFYFFYRYFFRLGFLDGREGYYFHLMQGLWYRTLVDAKLMDIEHYMNATNVNLKTAIRDRTGIDISKAEE